jgi:hypothetical protein
MHKIVLNAGLLIFALSVVFFSKNNLPILDVLLRSFLVFFIATVMLSIATIIFMKSINKVSLKKSKDLSQTTK